MLRSGWRIRVYFTEIIFVRRRSALAQIPVVWRPPGRCADCRCAHARPATSPSAHITNTVLIKVDLTIQVLSTELLLEHGWIHGYFTIESVFVLILQLLTRRLVI